MAKIKDLIQNASNMDIFKLLAIGLAFANAVLIYIVLHQADTIAKQRSVIWQIWQILNQK